jgi:hypothetical protein
MLVRTLGFAKSQVEYVLVKSIKPRLKFRETMSAQSSQISRAIVAGFEAGWKEVSFA